MLAVILGLHHLKDALEAQAAEPWGDTIQTRTTPE